MLCSGDVVVEYGAAHAKITTSVSTLAGVDLSVVGFEVDKRQFDCAQSVLKQRASSDYARLSKVMLSICNTNC